MTVGRETGLGVSKNNGMTQCCVTNSFSRSGNVLGMSGHGGFGGGVGLGGCLVHSGVGVGLAGAARTVIHMRNAFSSCSKPVEKNDRVCEGVLGMDPMHFPTCCRPSGACTNAARVLFNNGRKIRCVGPCTRVMGNCGRRDGAMVVTRVRLGRSFKG